MRWSSSPAGSFGLALNLEETEVGVIILGSSDAIREGDEVKTTGRLLEVPVGEAMLGRVVNALGQPLDGKGDIKSSESYPVEKIAPGIIKRKSVSVPVQTGIMAIDAMIPIGRGQRELIIGDRSTGKTTIAVDTIISQAKQNKAAAAGELQGHKAMVCIYVAVGQKNANIAPDRKNLWKRADAMDTHDRLSLPPLRIQPPISIWRLTPDARSPSGSWIRDRMPDRL